MSERQGTYAMPHREGAARFIGPTQQLRPACGTCGQEWPCEDARPAEIEWSHIERDGWCGKCGVSAGPWPCDAVYLLGRVRLLNDELEVERGPYAGR